MKALKQREIFSVQGFFDQLILVYANFESMEITKKDLNKVKQKNKQPFSTFISGFGKNMLEAWGINWNDQIAKTFLNNVVNNEMHKNFIGIFIPKIYTVYCIIFYGMNNQFEALQSKDVMTATVIKITRNAKSFTTVNSTTTNDEIDWELPNMTSSATKTVKKPAGRRKTKWGFPAIIKRKKNVFVVGHRVNRSIFYFFCTTAGGNGYDDDDDPKNYYRKN